jgi:hypothetical protein
VREPADDTASVPCLWDIEDWLDGRQSQSPSRV